MYRINNKLHIQTDISDDEVQCGYYNRMRARRTAQDELSNKIALTYFQKYLKILLGCENKCDQIFDKLSKLKQKIGYFIQNKCITQQLYIKNILKFHDPFYVNNTRKYVSIQVFISEYEDKKCIVKLYLYNKSLAPEYKYIIEHNFEDEVLFQAYAHTLNSTCDFISPKIYEIGEVTHITMIPNMRNNMKCRFIIMEYLDFVQFKDAIFNANDCARLIQKKDKLDVLLKTHLLHHNDLHDRNVLVDGTSDKLAIIDFGEAKSGPVTPIT